MRRFYQSLYNSETIKESEDSTLYEFPKEFNILNNGEKLALDKEISEEELKEQVFESGANKSLGPDGFANEFYKAMWTKI